MSAGPSHDPILAWQTGPLAEDLLVSLQPQRWPVPREALPDGTVLVGGAVRDALLGRPAQRPDLDLVVPAEAPAVAAALAGRVGGTVVLLDAERGIARLVLRGWSIDLASPLGPGLHQDLMRRDYSANAIALRLSPVAAGPALLDPSGGLEDLAAGRLRAISEANLLDDPLRLLRGPRLACELGLALDRRSLEWIRQHRLRLAAVAGERVLAELERMAAAPAGGGALAALVSQGLLEAWCPPVAGAEGWGAEAAGAALLPADGLAGLDAAAARLRGLEEAESGWALPLARLATLLDVASLERLRASRRLQQRCARLRSWWQRLAALQGDPDRLAEEERLRLQRQMEADLPALLLRLDPSWARSALPRWRDPDDPLFHPRPPLDGDRLQRELRLAPGPRIGRLLDHLCRERAFGRLSAQPEDVDSLTAARQWLTRDSEGRHG